MNSAVTGGPGVAERFDPPLDEAPFVFPGLATMLPVKDVSGALPDALSLAATAAFSAAALAEFKIASSWPGAISCVAAAMLTSAGGASAGTAGSPAGADCLGVTPG